MRDDPLLVDANVELVERGEARRVVGPEDRRRGRPLAELVERLGGLSVAERRTLPGLDARRADVIYAGAMILYRVALRADVCDVVISDRGVRWGALEEAADELAAAGSA
mgnify:CR=1 FL=1